MSGKDTLCAGAGVVAGVATAATGVGAPLTIAAQVAVTAGCVGLLKERGVSTDAKHLASGEQQAPSQGRSKDIEAAVTR